MVEGGTALGVGLAVRYPPVGFLKVGAGIADGECECLRGGLVPVSPPTPGAKVVPT